MSVSGRGFLRAIDICAVVLSFGIHIRPRLCLEESPNIDTGAAPKYQLFPRAASSWRHIRKDADGFVQYIGGGIKQPFGEGYRRGLRCANCEFAGATALTLAHSDVIVDHFMVYRLTSCHCGTWQQKSHVRRDVARERRARGSNPQPLTGHLISNEAASHSLTLRSGSAPAVYRGGFVWLRHPAPAWAPEGDVSGPHPTQNHTSAAVISNTRPPVHGTGSEPSGACAKGSLVAEWRDGGACDALSGLG